jgi:hypothetical protein
MRRSAIFILGRRDIIRVPIMHIGATDRSGVGLPAEAERADPRDLVPYLQALQMARADLLTGQIRGERLQSAVDDAVDRLLNGFFVREADESPGRVLAL